MIDTKKDNNLPLMDYLQEYVDGKLSHKQEHDLEELMLEDDLLADIVEGLLEMKKSGSKFNSDKMDSFIQSALTSSSDKTPKGGNHFLSINSLRKFIPMAVAACSIGVVLIIGYSVLRPKTDSLTIPDQGIVANSTEADAKLTSARHSFVDSNFEECISILEQELVNSNVLNKLDKENLLFHCYININQFEKAIRLYDKVKNFGSNQTEVKLLYDSIKTKFKPETNK